LRYDRLLLTRQSDRLDLLRLRNGENIGVSRGDAVFAIGRRDQDGIRE
jgi:hypothetical protein